MSDNASQFLHIQTQTGWGKTLADFAAWCGRPAHPEQKALDLGCGPGLLPALLQGSGWQALGLDLDPQMLATGLHPALAVGDAHCAPFAPGSFHLVTAVNVLFLQADPLGMLREMARLIHPQGQVVLFNPSEWMTLPAAAQLAEVRGLDGLARASLLNWAGRAERHFRWSEAELSTLFNLAGLQLTRTATRMGQPPLARLVEGVPLVHP